MTQHPTTWDDYYGERTPPCAAVYECDTTTLDAQPDPPRPPLDPDSEYGQAFTRALRKWRGEAA